MRVAGVRRGRAMTLVVAALVVIIAAGAFVLGSARLATDAVSERIDTGQPITVVFMLPIDVPGPSFELLLLDVDTKRAALLFVPGSVGVVLRDRQRVDAIATLYGPDSHQQVIDRLGELVAFDLGFYLDLSYAGLGRFIDVLGGVEILIPDPIQAVVGDRHVLLPSGNVTMDGDMARDYLSFQADGESEAERVERVHQLMQALLRSLAGDSPLLIDPTARRVLYEAVVTNLNRRSFDRLLATLNGLDADRVILLRTLGQTQDVSGRQLLFPHNEGSLLRNMVKQTMAALTEPLGDEISDLTLSVKVLNGTSANGLAAQAATLLESFGHKILAVANADHNRYERTVIISRHGDLEEARRAAEVIGCEENVVQVEDANGDDPLQEQVDVTVILGNDFDGHSCRER